MLLLEPRLLFTDEGNPIHLATLYLRRMTTSFHGLTFVTDPGRVFAPRATTEKLVDAALERIGAGPARSPTSAPVPARSRSRSRYAHQVEVGRPTLAPTRCASRRGTRSVSARRCTSCRATCSRGCRGPRPDRREPAVPLARHDGLRRRAREGRLLDRRRARPLPPPARRRSRPPVGDGGIVIQFDGEVLEAERSELPWLRSRLESIVAAAA